MLILFLIIYVVLLFFNKFIFKTFANYVNLIISIWVIAAILTLINPYGMYVPPNEIYGYILIFIILFEFFSVLLYKVKIFKDKKKRIYNYANWNLINICISLCVIILLPFSIKGLIIFVDGGFDSVRNAYLNYEICSNKMYMFLTLILIPLGEAIGFLSIINFFDTKKPNYSLLLFIFMMIEIIFLSGGRGRIVYYALFVLLLLIEQLKSINLKKFLRRNKKILIIVIIAAFILIWITNQRNLAGKGFIYNFYVYFTGGIHLFGEYLKQKSKFLLNNNLLLGHVLFSSIIYPFTFILKLLGFNVKAGYYIVNEVTSQFIPISNNTLINNSVTFLYYAFRDFGVYGIFIYTLLFSNIVMHLYKKKQKYNTLYYRCLFYFILIKMIFMILEFPFGQTSVLFTILYLKLLTYKGGNKNEIV